MSILATPAEIRRLLTKIKAKSNRWQLSPRPKNIELMKTAGASKKDIFERIYHDINWQDYLAGPEADNHVIPIPGDVWVFGMDLFGVPCYLKFQDRPTGVVVWISIHQASYPFQYPYH